LQVVERVVVQPLILAQAVVAVALVAIEVDHHLLSQRELLTL
jgi:hypothetical protein